MRDELARVDGVGEVMVFGVERTACASGSIRTAAGPGADDQRRRRGGREQNVEVAAGKIGEPPAPEGQAFQFTVNTLGRLERRGAVRGASSSRSGRMAAMVRLRTWPASSSADRAYDLTARSTAPDGCDGASTSCPAPTPSRWPTAIAKLDELAARFPEGLEYIVSYDATDVIARRCARSSITLFITLALVVLTVYVFLQNFRATLIPAVTIPVSLIGTFMVMAALGYSLNILTLFGLVLVIGIVVDDAIVVVENTSRLIEEGQDAEGGGAASR
jgi:HAE1 family hydrophobic/amphiphilic exporter-1